jgi:lysophospholipase L1-like esterase
LIEAVLTLTDARRGLGFNYVPLYTWGNAVRNNSLGFREKEFAIPKPAGTYRIMVLGDSLTWGAGLAAEQRYTDLLEDYLANRFPKRSIEVLNFGLSAAPTTQERDILRKYRESVQPDLIVIGFCLNDPQPKDQDHSPEKEAFERTYGRRIKALAERLARVRLRHVGELLEEAAHRFAEKLGIVPTWEVALQRTYEKNSREWLDFEEALRDIKSMSDRMGLPPPVFAILNQGLPDRSVSYEEPSGEIRLWSKWYRQAEESAAMIGFRTHNHERDVIWRLPGNALTVNAVDGHPSARLNEVYAKKLFEIIERQMTKDSVSDGR